MAAANLRVLASALLGIVLMPAVLLAQATDDHLRTELGRAALAWGVHTAIVEIVVDGNVVASASIGHSDSGSPVSADTLFRIGSVSKTFTAAAVGSLIEQGALKWTTQMGDCVPPWNEAKSPVSLVTVDDALSHGSGFGSGDLMWVLGRDLTPDELLMRAVHLDRVAARGVATYGNMLYVALGSAVAAKEGRAWESAIRLRFLAPLGMRRTCVDAAGDRDAVCAAVPRCMYENVAPALGMWSCTRDLRTWVAFWMGRGSTGGQTLIKEETWTELLRPRVEVDAMIVPAKSWYACGWRRCSYGGCEIAYATGVTRGTASVLIVAPDERVGVIVVASGDRGSFAPAVGFTAFDLARGLARGPYGAQLLAHEKEKAKLVDSVRSSRRETQSVLKLGTPDESSLRGRYANAIYGQLSVGEGLVIECAGVQGRIVEMWKEVGEIAWVTQGLPYSEVRFSSVSDGKYEKVKLQVGGCGWAIFERGSR